MRLWGWGDVSFPGEDLPFYTQINPPFSSSRFLRPETSAQPAGGDSESGPQRGRGWGGSKGRTPNGGTHWYLQYTAPCRGSSFGANLTEDNPVQGQRCPLEAVVPLPGGVGVGLPNEMI